MEPMEPMEQLASAISTVTTVIMYLLLPNFAPGASLVVSSTKSDVGCLSILQLGTETTTPPLDPYIFSLYSSCLAIQTHSKGHALTTILGLGTSMAPRTKRAGPHPHPDHWPTQQAPC